MGKEEVEEIFKKMKKNNKEMNEIRLRLKNMIESEPILTKKQAIEIVKNCDNLVEIGGIGHQPQVECGEGEICDVCQFLINFFKIKKEELE